MVAGSALHLCLSTPPGTASPGELSTGLILTRLLQTPQAFPPTLSGFCFTSRCLQLRSAPPIAVHGCAISHEQLTVPWKSNHPAEVDVCLFVLVDTDVHTAVLTVSHAHKKSHHHGGGYDFYAYGAVQLAVCSPSVYFISHTRRTSFTLYTHFTITHTPIKARRRGHTDGSTSASQAHNSLMGTL